MSIEPTAVGYVLLERALEQAGHSAEAKAALEKAKQLATDLSQAQQTADQLLVF
jgi:hypothetical protein